MSHAQNVHRVQTTEHSLLHLPADSTSDSSALTLKSHSRYLSMQMPSLSRLSVEHARAANRQRPETISIFPISEWLGCIGGPGAG